MKFHLIFPFLFLSVALLHAQEEPETASQFTLSAYLDTYYAAFSDSLGPNELQKFTTVSPRSERFGINTAQITGAYSSDLLRGTLTLHYGDIAEATWSDPFRMIQEAYAGLRLGKQLWFDAGFFATHVGTESFLPKNNWLSSTAVATYNEPFYQSGARLSYEGDGPWSAQLWVLSGYNFFLDRNDSKSVGLLLTYSPTENFSATYTNILGNEAPDTAAFSQYRTYHNLYFNWQMSPAFALKLGGDFGTQTRSALEDQELAYMYNALLAIRYQAAPAWALTARVERFYDPDGFISGLYTDRDELPAGLELNGLTLGLEYRPAESAFLRLESRYLQTADHLPIFWNNGPERNRWEFMATFGLVLEKTWGAR